jgi:anti-sigma factor RsiW
MSKKPDTPAIAPPHPPCRSPELGGLLPDYIVELLSDEASAAVREHLQTCGHCRDDYQNVMDMRAAARRLFAAAGREQEAPAPTSRSTVVRRLSDYKK